MFCKFEKKNYFTLFFVATLAQKRQSGKDFIWNRTELWYRLLITFRLNLVRTIFLLLADFQLHFCSKYFHLPVLNFVSRRLRLCFYRSPNHNILTSFLMFGQKRKLKQNMRSIRKTYRNLQPFKRKSLWICLWHEYDTKCNLSRQ